MSQTNLVSLAALLAIAACGRHGGPGQPPDFTPPATTEEYTAMMSPGLPISVEALPTPGQVATASLWTGDRGSLLGDNRAMTRGDILTVVIEIDDSAQMTNSTDRARDAGQQMRVDALFGLPEQTNLPGGATLAPAVDLGSSSQFSGEGSVRRNERLTLRVAATIIDVMPNGVLSISGTQEVRVNNELRELLVTGFVRPADITRQNEITYDNIASARISYGGRGLISQMQEPRWGQQAVEAVLPF